MRDRAPDHRGRRPRRVVRLAALVLAGVVLALILLLGASVGSIFATLHGALDHRLQRVLIVHGGGDLPSILRASLEGNVPKWLLPAAVRLARIPTDSFDPVRYVRRIAPRELVVVAARRDRIFPPATVEAYYALAGEPKKLLWTETPHVGNETPAIVTAVLDLLTAYLDLESSTFDAPRGSSS